MSNHIISAKGHKKNAAKRDFASIILMSTAPGHRMKSYGPVLLLPMGSRLLIDIHIDAIKAVYRNFELILCCGFEANKVARYVKSKYSNLNIRIVEDQLYEDSSCCESLRIALNNISSDNILVLSGETMIFPELVKVHADESYILTQEKASKKSELELGSIVTGGVVSNIGFDLPNTWCEAFFLYGKQPIECLRRIVSMDGYENKLIFEALNDFVLTKFNLREVRIPFSTIKINNVKNYHKIRDIYERDSTQLFIRNVV